MKGEATALSEVCAQMGKRKHQDRMNGVASATGALSAAEVFSIIYGGEPEMWQKDLDFHSERMFQRLLHGRPVG